MTEPTEVFVVCAGFQKTSVIKCRDIINVIFDPNNNISVKVTVQSREIIQNFECLSIIFEKPIKPV